MQDEIRGKGGAARYYAPNSASSHKRCRNCNEKGHLAKNCPIPKVKSVGDHDNGGWC